MGEMALIASDVTDAFVTGECIIDLKMLYSWSRNIVPPYHIVVAIEDYMYIRESEWLGRRLASLPSDELFPMLNVGSSTEEYRTVMQPWIDQNIFAPIRNRGGKVCHLDMKKARGVDIVGNLLDHEFLDHIAQMKVRSVMVSSLFQHVTNRQEVADTLLKILPPGGYIIVSGPNSFPYCPDPIDTMFRPTVEEMHKHFPGTGIVDSAIIDSGNWRQWDDRERGRSLARTMMRLMLPFYRPLKWWELARGVPYFFKHITAFAIILRKTLIPVPS
jgi:hypothetical protein